MAIIPDFFIDSVVSIGVKGINDKTRWIGTGFIVFRKAAEAGKCTPFLVSNRHVFQDKLSVILRMRVKDTDNLLEFEVRLKDGDGTLYKVHPIQTPSVNIDIAVLPFASYIDAHNLRFYGFDIDDNAMSSKELRENGVDEGSIIYMLGYPLGLVNVQSNLPLCRMGCIARMSESQIEEEYIMLVDIQNFPGNSGSPIVLRPELVSIKGTKSLSRSVLVGIVNSYIPYTEALQSRQTGEVVEIRQENSGIANVFPVEYIRDIIDIESPKQETKSEI